MGTLDRTWRLFNQSLSVLSADTEILLFPVLSAVSALLVTGGFATMLYFDGTLARWKLHAISESDYLVLFLWYYCIYFVGIFFNSALVACANIRISGGNPGLGDGLSAAMQRIGRIAMWALVSATVGVVLSSLRNRNRALAWVSTALSVGWSLMTYLIIPIIVIEDLGISTAMQRSSELFRKVWGEEVSGGFGFGLLSVLLMLPGFGMGVLAIPYDIGAGIILIVVYTLILATVMSAARGVFTVVLYRYATEGTAPAGFHAGLLAPSRGWDRPGFGRERW